MIAGLKRQLERWPHKNEYDVFMVKWRRENSGVWFIEDMLRLGWIQLWGRGWSGMTAERTGGEKTERVLSLPMFASNTELTSFFWLALLYYDHFNNNKKLTAKKNLFSIGKRRKFWFGTV